MGNFTFSGGWRANQSACELAVDRFFRQCGDQMIDTESLCDRFGDKFVGRRHDSDEIIIFNVIFYQVSCRRPDSWRDDLVHVLLSPVV